MSTRRIVAPFLVFTFVLSWASWLTLAWLVRSGALDAGTAGYWALLMIGGMSPGIVAFLVRKTRDDSDGFRRFLRQHLAFRVRPAWFAFVVLVPLIFTAFPWLIALVTGRHPGPLFGQPIWNLLVLVPIMVVGGGVEEPGWRGVLLPELTRRMSFLASTLVVGAIWYLWHLPLWLVEGTGQSTLNVWGFLPTVIALSFLFSSLWWTTHSIGLCILFHAFFNAYPTMVRNPPTDGIAEPALKLVLAAIIFFALWRKGRPSGAQP